MTVTTGTWWFSAVITLGFAGFGRAVRGVTTSGAIAGGMVCFVLLRAAGWGGFAALCAVFLLTWFATSAGYGRKQSFGIAEPSSGRDAQQVLANLGVASFCAVLYALLQDHRLLLAAGAALAEAAADTVSSEIGQARGGTPRLLTNGRPVAIGSDGAVSLAGTAAGIAAALVIAGTCAFSRLFSWRSAPACAIAAVLGMFADSLLGATLERAGKLSNNAVNFLSTALAAGMAILGGVLRLY
ncbi:MAG TPA: DUF92 domain-containing protein [Terriglobales bacterium]|nr:DUF92 domain-containing protein [Terriglobales bacterium]